MIELTKGNLLEAPTEALVNTVNTEGVMGKGVALQFAKKYPDMLAAYKQACKAGEVLPGQMHIFERGEMFKPRYIINFPTKRHWRSPSRMEDIEAGLQEVAVVTGAQVHSGVDRQPDREGHLLLGGHNCDRTGKTTGPTRGQHLLRVRAAAGLAGNRELDVQTAIGAVGGAAFPSTGGVDAGGVDHVYGPRHAVFFGCWDCVHWCDILILVAK